MDYYYLFCVSIYYFQVSFNLKLFFPTNRLVNPQLPQPTDKQEGQTLFTLEGRQ